LRVGGRNGEQDFARLSVLSLFDAGGCKQVLRLNLFQQELPLLVSA
jgi:hypothetical protein